MNTKILNKAIELYLTEFDSHWSDEKYKWAAVKCFELNWDIDSQHFDEMLERSLSKTENLLDSGNFFPCRTINSLAKLEPETVRKMFINLYDESLDLSTRINDFIVAAESLRAKYNDQIGKNHFQTTNSISIYLWLRYPDKYYLYKYTVYKQADKILRVGIWFKANGSPQEVINGYKFYDKLTKLLVANTDFVNCIRSHIDGNTSFYQDPKFHIATIDFGFWLSKYFKVDTSTIDNTHYWMYAPGDNASVWDDCKNDGIMCIGWHEMGDLSAYADRDSITAALQKTYNKPNSSCKNNALALWQFVHEIKPGDIVYAKKGTSQVVGRGIVEGDYEYNSKNTEYPNVRRVRWTHDGAWSLPNKTALKTLTDITNQFDCVSNLEDMIVNNAMVPKVDNNVRYWWLVANPKIWSIADLAVGGTQKYSLYGDKDKPRRIFQNFLEAKEGDIVIGYESTPNKKIVAFAEVGKGNDGKEIEFRKTEALRNPIEYSDLKEYDELSNMQFFAKGMQGSFFALTKDEFDCIEYIIRESNPLQKQVSTQAYTKADFLREVYISENRYDRLVKQLELKKNIILQGAPGVGKTFMAKRLAYSILGKEDDSYIEIVQFHQNYTYEDFMVHPQNGVIK
jgi:5-methylcytosine-specific restriction protein B